MTYDHEPGLAVYDPGPPERLVPIPERNGSGGLAFYIGWALNRRVALGLDIDLQAGVHDDAFDSIVGTFGVQAWPMSRVSIRAGIGSGSVALTASDDADIDFTPGEFYGTTVADGGLAFAAAVGVEVVR